MIPEQDPMDWDKRRVEAAMDRKPKPQPPSEFGQALFMRAVREMRQEAARFCPPVNLHLAPDLFQPDRYRDR